MYTCRYTDDKGQKDRTVCKVGMVGRYLALPYLWFLFVRMGCTGRVTERGTCTCLLVGCCTAFFTIGSHRHVCDVESWDGRIKDDEEMGKREGML